MPHPVGGAMGVTCHDDISRGCEFLPDAPFSNLVSARCALLSNCGCMVGGVKPVPTSS